MMIEAEEEELDVDKAKMENYITLLRNMGSVEGMELLTRILPHENSHVLDISNLPKAYG